MRINRMNEVARLYQANGVKSVDKVAKCKKDELEISTFGVEYHKARQLAKEVPDIRADKVEDIKERIRSGTYSVDAKEVAEKMLSQFDMRG